MKLVSEDFDESTLHTRSPSDQLEIGGLFSCCVCCGGEASLTSHCCGRKLTEEEQDRIMSGEIDFIHGEWIDPRSRKNKSSDVGPFMWKELDGRILQLFGD